MEIFQFISEGIGIMNWKQVLRDYGFTITYLIIGIVVIYLYIFLFRQNFTDVDSAVITLVITGLAAFWRLDKERVANASSEREQKRNESRQVIITLLNLVNEFPDVMDEKLRWGEIIVNEEQVDYRPFKEEIVAFKREFHGRINDVKNVLTEYGNDMQFDALNEVSLLANLVQKSIAELTTKAQLAIDKSNHKGDIQQAKDIAALEMLRLVKRLGVQNGNIFDKDDSQKLAELYRLLDVYVYQYIYLEKLAKIFSNDGNQGFKNIFELITLSNQKKVKAISLSKLTNETNLNYLLKLLDLDELDSLEEYQAEYYQSLMTREVGGQARHYLYYVLKDILLRNALRFEGSYFLNVYQEEQISEIYFYPKSDTSNDEVAYQSFKENLHKLEQVA